MKKITGIMLLAIVIACNISREKFIGHKLKAEDGTLQILYSGEGDIVQFKMFEGLSQILKQNSEGVFEGELEIPNIDDGIFSYEIIVQREDSLGKMTTIEYNPESVDQHFLWIGKNRNISFSKATDLNGKVINKEINSSFLGENRRLTIYNPEEFKEDTPIIYLTDGSIVAHYAAYIDKMITEQMIIPIKLVGVHSSRTNRYMEYVNNGIEVDLFKKHDDFFYKEVLQEIESETPNWQGKRFIHGFSNGAAFCMYAGINHPKMFEEVIVFSTADYISEFLRPIEFRFKEYPKFYMGAGRYEERIYKDNIKFTSRLEAKNIDVDFKTFISGHDYNVWKFEFLEYLKKRFRK
jgi:enterochelin esterase-like enzyme